MTRYRLTGAEVVVPDGLRHLDVVISDATIEALIDPSAPEDGADTVALGGGLLAPGFIDLQVNGGGGVLFNDETTRRGVEEIAAAHRPFGTCGMLPTLISDGPAALRAAVQAVDEAMEAGVPGVLGVHLEGPFLNAQKKGIHDQQHFRALTPEELEVLTSLKRGKTLVTLAPETVRTEDIRALVAHGVHVALGHSLATYDEAKAAEAHGVTGYTHLFNAMPALASREPGAIAAALEGGAWCGLIADGHHVDPAMLRLAIRAKIDKRFCLVTDAMPCAGTMMESFDLGGQTITVAGGACRGPDGTLAGSALTMDKAVRFALQELELSSRDALRMASFEPAAFLRLSDDLGVIRPGARASLVHLDETYHVIRTVIDGSIETHRHPG
ncbi:MAG: N-acetylglucosamine-6-phosphate deacetylase [Pseudomonadota bacterium]